MNTTTIGTYAQFLIGKRIGIKNHSLSLNSSYDVHGDTYADYYDEPYGDYYDTDSENPH